MRTRSSSSLRSATSRFAAAEAAYHGCPATGKVVLGTSKQVNTPTTPGTAFACVTSIETTRPLPMVEWRILATRHGLGQRSSVNMARPVTLSRASTRLTCLPTSLYFSNSCSSRIKILMT